MTIKFTKQSSENTIKLTTKSVFRNWDPKHDKDKPIFSFNSGSTGQVSLGKTQEKLLFALAGGHNCEGCGDPDDLFTLTEKDLKEAKRRFENKDNYLFGNINVKEFRYDEKAGIANLTTNNGDVLRVDLLTEYEKANGLDSSKNISQTSQNKASGVEKTATNNTTVTKTNNQKTNKYSEIPQKWIPYVQNTAKKYGYSEDLILNIISYESFTPSAKYKNENGGLYEVGFGHTTQANHNNKFGKGFKITVAQAFDWLGQDIKDKEAEIKKFGSYYDYDNLPKPLKEAFIDVAFNRGEKRLDPNSKSFDTNYKSVRANIQQGYLGSAMVRLRQETFYVHEAGVRKRNVLRFLKVVENLPAEQIVNSMDLFNREYYYTKTISMLNKAEADRVRKTWNNIYYTALPKLKKN